ncbi:hypothetical protein H0H87_005887 [Tephrocybe sp. NHM501043]|nr:hypothetical protein H0H87_005887 [Tephrocybe sp. NHM501043]
MRLLIPRFTGQPLIKSTRKEIATAKAAIRTLFTTTPIVCIIRPQWDGKIFAHTSPNTILFADTSPPLVAHISDDPSSPAPHIVADKPHIVLPAEFLEACNRNPDSARLRTFFISVLLHETAHWAGQANATSSKLATPEFLHGLPRHQKKPPGEFGHYFGCGFFGGYVWPDDWSNLVERVGYLRAYESFQGLQLERGSEAPQASEILRFGEGDVLDEESVLKIMGDRDTLRIPICIRKHNRTKFGAKMTRIVMAVRHALWKSLPR